jgi:glycosyltransferase involved in cell wall biosynthesis
MNKLVGVVYTGQRGRDPLDPRVWSSSSRSFFNEMTNNGLIHQVVGIELPSWRRYLYILKNFATNRKRWRRKYLMDPAYKAALTNEIGKCLPLDDRKHDVIQIGAMYNSRNIIGAGSRCFSYSDGNMAEQLSSPYADKGMSIRFIERAMAYEKSVYHSMDKVLTMSEYLRQSMIRNFDVPAERVVAIGGGINLTHIPELVIDKRYDSQEVLFIGIDFPRKGGWELLKAFRFVRERLPHACLHLVGPQSLNIPPGQAGGVVLHGFLNKDEPAGRAKLDEIFRRCCLFVMPSLYEPFGIAPLEAMVHHIPSLVTNRWALRELVTPGETGDHVECGSVEDLQNKMISLLSDPQKLKQMGDRGRQVVLEQYTWTRVVERTRQALET